MRFELEVAPIDLELTLGCGQTFRWRPTSDGSWTGVLGNQSISMYQKGQRILGEAIPGDREIEDDLREFLRAQDDIGKIQRRFQRDTVLVRGMKQMKGLRIVKLDEWECLASYVLATYANIPRIMKMVDSLAVRYGQRITRGAHSFPDRRRLSRATTRELMSLGLGYRAGYLKELCELVDEPTLIALSRSSYLDLRKRLIELPGVGDKVADCACLFGFGRLESFPIDVWIERALARLYGEKGSYGRLRTFAARRFGEYAGYAQEYLYYNERVHAREQTCVFSEQRQE